MTIDTLATECRTLATDPVPAHQAWQAICRAISGLPLRLGKQRSGWGRSHYGDPNARGSGPGYTYTGHRGIALGDQGSMVTREGGQNSGGYCYDAENDDCLFFATDGRVYEVCAVDGSWSQWQGSSSSYSLTWREYAGEISDESLAKVTEEIVWRLTEYRDDLLRRKVAGASAANRILAAMQSIV